MSEQTIKPKSNHYKQIARQRASEREDRLIAMIDALREQEKMAG